MNTKNFQYKLVFIIPTLSNIEGLLKVLNTLSKYNKDEPVVIVNNNKKTNLINNLPVKDLNNKIIVLNQNENTGFAKACNDGAKKAKELFHPKYLVFLNDDVLIKENFTDMCIKKIQTKKWIACSPALFKTNNDVENFGYKVLPIGKVELILDPKSEKIDGLSATALIFSSVAFFKLKGFDERFFAYLEDVDLFLRAKKEKYKFGVCKNVRIFHKGQETSSKMSTKKAYLDFKNWILIIYKNWGWEGIKNNLPEILIERFRNLFGIFKSLSS